MLCALRGRVTHMHPSGNPTLPSRPAGQQRLRVSWVVIAALLAIPLAATVWFVTVGTDPLPIDAWWHDSVVVTRGSVPFGVAHALHVVGGTRGMTVIGVTLAMLFLCLRRLRDAAMIATTMLAVVAATSGLKLFVGRPRPDMMLVEQLETSFPSGHSLASAALFTALWSLIVVHTRHRWMYIVSGCVGTIVVLAMMWSRTALHVHWLSDTVSGALIGVALGLTIARWILVFPAQPLLITEDAPTRGA